MKKPRRLDIFAKLKKQKENPLEKTIEGDFRTYALKRGCLCYKFTSPSQRSVPDRIIISPQGRVMFFELKRKGRKPTPQQSDQIKKLKDHNCFVGWADNIVDAKKFLDDNLLLDGL